MTNDYTNPKTKFVLANIGTGFKNDNDDAVVIMKIAKEKDTQHLEVFNINLGETSKSIFVDYTLDHGPVEMASEWILPDWTVDRNYIEENNKDLNDEQKNFIWDTLDKFLKETQKLAA